MGNRKTAYSKIHRLTPFQEEEKDLSLLNEGMRYRDLETGTFLTRDPIGYADGPNVYCYVHCNPIMSFDPFGLKDDSDYQAELDAAKTQYEEDLAAKQAELDKIVSDRENAQDLAEMQRNTGAQLDKKSEIFDLTTQYLDKKTSLESSQAALKNNRWGDDSIVNPNPINGQAGTGENHGKIGYLDNDRDMKWADMTSAEKNIKYDGNGNVRSLEDQGKAALGAIQTNLKDNQMLSAVDNVGKVVGIGSGVIVTLPATVPMATAAGMYWLQNPVQCNDVMNSVMGGLSGAPPSPVETASGFGTTFGMGVVDKVRGN